MNETTKKADCAVEFYDHIAPDYDSLMQADADNDVVRREVAHYFCQAVPRNTLVLDFGGGTGLDLEWLSRAGYRVVFCEPSQKMREFAMRRASSDLAPRSSITFLASQQADWMRWLDPCCTPPCTVRSVLANFAVLNCLESPEIVFAALAHALEPGGDLIFTVLDTSWPYRLFRPHRWPMFISAWLKGEEPKLYPTISEISQTAYLHSPARLRSAAEVWFRLEQTTRLSGFMLFHCTRYA